MDWKRTLVGVIILLILPSNIIGVWWVVGSPVNFDPNTICKRSKKTNKGTTKQRAICRKEPEIVEKVVKGTTFGVTECQYQLRYSKWNCTTARNSFKKVIRQADTRETALVNAITSAGATYAVTQACSMGELHQCGCARNPEKRKQNAAMNAPGNEQSWQWGGCDDDIDYGYAKSKEFMDTPQNKESRDIRTLITLHNNEAGRLAIRGLMFTECKCHGLSGSCTLKTCWRKMPAFRKVGDQLKLKFNSASKVIGANNGERILPENESHKTPQPTDLVYATDSPDFCKPNKKIGSLGTFGRRCNNSSMDVGGCDVLCCGRGFTEHVITRREPCRCRFHWCCEVDCDTCTTQQTIHTCN